MFYTERDFVRDMEYLRDVGALTWTELRANPLTLPHSRGSSRSGRPTSSPRSAARTL